MNLRTIQFWVIYDPKNRLVITERQFKKDLVAKCHVPEGCVIVRMRGHYHPTGTIFTKGKR